MIVPPHEELKRNLVKSFETKEDYTGSEVRELIHRTNFKVLNDNIKPLFIKRAMFL
jgi:hypothetical protein